MKPLLGVKVVDFTKVLAGPLCAQYLGDFGADVIKIEPCKDGDDTRRWPPFRGGDGTVFLSANRNKRSLAIDLKTAAGKEIARRLVREADVVLESFGPGVAQRLGIDYETLRQDNPRLVYCSISGFGRRGPTEGRQGLRRHPAGLQRDDVDHRRARWPAVAQPVLAGGPGDRLSRGQRHPRRAAAARTHRRGCADRDGAVRLGDVASSPTSTRATGRRGTQPAKSGSGHESLCPYQAFEAADKHVLVGVANDALWRKFCALAGLDDYVDDPRFRTNADRVRHRAETVELVESVVATRTCDDWVRLLGEAGIPAAPINSFADVMAHPHTRESGMLVEYEHAGYGRVQGIAQPIAFNGERNAPQAPPPLHGEHTAAILATLGYSDADIRRLQAEGVIHARELASAQAA